MQKWYRYLRGGQSQEPVPGQEILRLMEQGVLHAFDPVHLEGDEGWKPIMEQEGLREHLDRLRLNSNLQDMWVVLQPKARGKVEGKKGFLQVGPVSTQWLREALQEGRVSYQDRVWREGLTEWQIIGQTPSLSPLHQKPVTLERDQEIELPPLPEWSEDELLQSVQRVQKGFVQELEIEPDESEVQGDEQVEKFLHQGEVDRVSTQRMVKKAIRTQAGRGSGQKSEGLRRPRSMIFFKAPPLWLRVLPLAFLVMAFAIYLVMSAHPQWEKEPPLWIYEQLPPSLEGRPEGPPQAVDQRGERVGPVVEPAEVRMPPTYLKLNISGLTGGQPTLHFSSDASSHYPLYLHLVARAGEVEEVSRVWLHRALRRSQAQQDFEFSFKDQGLHPGRYRLRAELAGQVVEEEFVVGRRTQRHIRALRQAFKRHSFSYQKEKRLLYLRAQQLENQLARASRRWPPGWTSVENLDSLKAGQFMFPDLWLEMRDLYIQAQRSLSRRQPVSPEFFRKVRGFRARVASLSVAS